MLVVAEVYRCGRGGKLVLIFEITTSPTTTSSLLSETQLIVSHPMVQHDFQPREPTLCVDIFADDAEECLQWNVVEWERWDGGNPYRAFHIACSSF